MQIALDAPSLEGAKKVIEALPGSDRIILEVGTPLIKRYGTRVIGELRTVAKDKFIIADLKTLDVGKVEVDIAYEDTADAVVAAGLAPPETLDATIQEARRLGIYAVVDMLNVEDVLTKLKSLKELPDIVILHRGIDQESGRTCGLERIQMIRKAFSNKKLLIAVAGGIVPETAKEALEQGATYHRRKICYSKQRHRTCSPDFLELTPRCAKTSTIQSSQNKLNQTSLTLAHSILLFILIAKNFRIRKAAKKAIAETKKVGR